MADKPENDAPEKTTAEVLVDCLKAEGVSVVFGIPGEENLDLMFALKRSGIRFISTRHEQGAAFMADVYGRLTGHAGVCLATLGPGATNLVTGVADAFLDGAPLVAITGQVSSELMQLTSHQYLDLSAMFSPITKRSKVVMRPDTVAEICRLAFKYAEAPKPGATHIDLPKKWHTHDDMRIVNISGLPADVNQLYEPDVEVAGDISDSIYQILRTARRDDAPEPEGLLAVGRRLREDFERLSASDAYPMKPARILADVRSVLGRSDILVSDVGAHKIWIGRDYPCYEPRTCLISNGFASMGFSVPGAIAAKLVHPERRVLAVTGDGGFMMNSQELETAVREGVPIVVLIWEDEHYGLIRWKEEEQFGDTFGVGFSNPDFRAYAEAMHCHGCEVQSSEELVPALEDAFSHDDAPSVVVVRVDYSENMALTNRLRQEYGA